MGKSKKKNEHTQHRERMRERFLTSGLEGFSEHEILEMILYYTIGRKDVNPIAHELIENFGSISQVLDAEIESLMCVAGVGEKTAFLLHYIGKVIQYKEKSDTKRITRLSGPQAAAAYIGPRIRNKPVEELHIYCLSQQNKPIYSCVLSVGNSDSVNVDNKQIIRIASIHNCNRIILAHNHPDGEPFPSSADIEATRTLVSVLATVDIMLIDHIICAGKEYYSFNTSGIIGGIEDFLKTGRHDKYGSSAVAFDYTNLFERK